MRVGGNGGNPKKAESHLRRSESTQGAPGVQGGLFGVQEGAVGSQEVAGKWRCMNDFSQKVEDFSRFFEIGSFRPWRRRRWSRLAERSPKPVFPLRTDHGKWVSLKTRKIRRFSRRTSRPGYWPRGDVRADALGSVLQVHVGRFWGLVKWDTFLVSNFKWETGFGLLSPS